jgi:hypothetical protein
MALPRHTLQNSPIIIGCERLVFLIVLSGIAFGIMSCRRPTTSSSNSVTIPSSPAVKQQEKVPSESETAVIPEYSGQPIMVRVAIFDDTQKKPVPAKAEIWFRGHGSWWLKQEMQYRVAIKKLGKRPSGSRQLLILYPEGRKGKELEIPYMMTDEMNDEGSARDTIFIEISDTEVKIYGLPIEVATGKSVKYKR